MPARRAILDVLSATTEELSMNAKFVELPPCPQRVVLTIALPEMLESPRMLPKIPFVEQLLVGHILAAGQPLEDRTEAINLNAAFTFKVPRESVPRASREAFRRWYKMSNFPRVIDRNSSNVEPNQWGQKPSE